MSLSDFVQAVRWAFFDLADEAGDWDSYVVEVWQDYLIAYVPSVLGGGYYRVPFAASGSAVTIADPSSWTAVEPGGMLVTWEAAKSLPRVPRPDAGGRGRRVLDVRRQDAQRPHGALRLTPFATSALTTPIRTNRGETPPTLMPSPQEQLKDQVTRSIDLTQKMLDKQDGLEAQIKSLEEKQIGSADLKEQVNKMATDNAEAIKSINVLSETIRKEVQDQIDEATTKALGRTPGVQSMTKAVEEIVKAIHGDSRPQHDQVDFRRLQAQRRGRRARSSSRRHEPHHVGRHRRACPSTRRRSVVRASR